MPRPAFWGLKCERLMLMACGYFCLKLYKGCLVDASVYHFRLHLCFFYVFTELCG